MDKQENIWWIKDLDTKEATTPGTLQKITQTLTHISQIDNATIDITIKNKNKK